MKFEPINSPQFKSSSLMRAVNSAFPILSMKNFIALSIAFLSRDVQAVARQLKVSIVHFYSKILFSLKFLILTFNILEIAS